MARSRAAGQGAGRARGRRRSARRRFAPRLDVLVNNVGGFWSYRHVTADGHEHTFGGEPTNLCLRRHVGDEDINCAASALADDLGGCPVRKVVEREVRTREWPPRTALELSRRSKTRPI